MKEIITATFLVAALTSFGYGQSEEELALATQNPVADLISVPFQNNVNLGIGEFDRMQDILNIQPVYPIPAGDVNVVTRTIVPLMYQPDLAAESGGTFGLGDVNATLFLTPAAPGKVIWGAGPVLSFPTATDDVLGTKKFAAGPSAVVVGMPGKWTVGFLVNNVWSVAGDEDRADINAMMTQVFATYNLPDAWAITSAPVMTANWEAESDDRWNVPVGLGVSKVTTVGKVPMSIAVQGFYTAVHPENLPYADWSVRTTVALIFPK